MKFNKENWEDLKKYFEKSYMKFPKLGEQAVYVESVCSDGLSGKLLPNNEHEGWKYTFTEGSGLDFEYILPKKSFFEYEGLAYLLERIPAQQYKRGLCRDNCSIKCLTIHDGFIAVSLSLELVNAYTMKQNFQGFRKESTQGSYPVSSRIAVDSTGKIYVDTIRVGAYWPDAGEIILNHPTFKEEIEAVLSANHQNHITINTPRKSVERKKPAKEILV